MNKLQAFAFGTVTTLALSAVALAAPGIDGSATVRNNKVGVVVVSGGKGSVGLGPFKGGDIDLSAGANVNSIVVKGGKIGGSAIVEGNKADTVVSTGGQANVNSIVVSK
ncbi:MAG: hypothetical protein ABI605_01165 [Rhizobacter sp.]